MLVGAGICALIAVICLALFCGCAVLHVAMQLQRREIFIKYSRAVFLKLLLASIAVVFTVGAVILGAVHFAVGGRTSGLAYDTGICYYLQVRKPTTTINILVL